MPSSSTYRKLCLTRQTELRGALTAPAPSGEALGLFLGQHAMLHSGKMNAGAPWSFEDEALDDLPEAGFRRIPPGGEHSIAWLVWHTARCEDITLNLLVAGSPQVLHRENWLPRLKVSACDTGNAMSAEEVAAFSAAVDLEALRAYRLAVGCRTQEIARALRPEELKRKVQAERMQRVWDEGAVVEPARGIAEYWAGSTVAGLLLMPATRHNLTHLNEALEIKRRLR